MKETSQTPLVLKISLFQEFMADIEIIKSKEAYGYNYADLDAIITTISPILKEIGIGYYHYTDYDYESKNNIVYTVLFNKENVEDKLTSRTLIDRSVQLAKMNAFMVEGSAITYFRRYHLVAMLGLLTDEDHDAGGKKKQPTTSKSNAPVGRSVESTSNAPTETDYVAIFNNLVKNKPQDKVNKTFELYKTQMSNEDINTITNIIKEAYENK